METTFDGGTVIHGTLRIDDLIPAFIGALDTLRESQSFEPGADAPERVARYGSEDDEMGEEADEVEITEDDRDILAKAADILSKIAGGGGADAGMDDMDMDMEDEAGMRDAMFEGDDELGEGMDDGDMIDEVQIVDENKLVQEVTRRVAERLRKAIKSRK